MFKSVKDQVPEVKKLTLKMLIGVLSIFFQKKSVNVLSFIKIDSIEIICFLTKTGPNTKDLLTIEMS